MSIFIRYIPYNAISIFIPSFHSLVGKTLYDVVAVTEAVPTYRPK